MSFHLVHDTISDELKKYPYCMNHKQLYDKDGFSWHSVLREMSYPNQKSLDESLKPRDRLNYARITNSNSKVITYHNSTTNERFSITYYLADIDYEVFLASHSYYQAGQRITVKKFYYSAQVSEAIMISVQDILRLYYYKNRDKKNLGFDSLSQADIKLYKNLVKKAISTENQPNLKNPLAVFDNRLKLLRIESETPKWAFEDYLRGLVMVKFNHVAEFQQVRDILDMHHYHEIQEDKIEVIEYDPPISLVKAYELNEDLEDHWGRVVYSELTRELTSKEKMDLEKYPEYLLNITHREGIVWGGRAVMKCHVKERDFTYPSYAFRNYMVSSWVPGHTSNRISDEMDDKNDENRITKLKYLKDKRGKFITQYNDGENENLFYGGRDGRGKFGNRTTFEKDRNKEKRHQRYDVKSAKDLV